MQETIITGIVIATLVFLILFVAIVLLTKRYFKMISDAERKMYSAVLEAQERERQIIAQDIHDELGGLLTSAKLSIAMTRNELAIEPIQECLQHINDVLEMASVVAKNASNALTPTAIAKFGLKGAVIDIQDRYRKTSINFDVVCDYEQDPSEFVQINLYRIISEVVHNSVKYANPTTIRVHLKSTKKHGLIIDVADDGKGFDLVFEKANKKSHGLSNIENRCALINAQLRVRTALNKGCHYEIILKQPYENPN